MQARARGLDEPPDRLHALRIAFVVDRVRFLLPDDEPVLDLAAAGQAQPDQLPARPVDEGRVAAGPQLVPLGTEILHPEAARGAVRDHVGRPRREVLDAADPHLRVVDVEPLVVEPPPGVDDEPDDEEVAVAQPLRRRQDLGRRGRVDAGDQVTDRGGRDHRVGAVSRPRAPAVARGRLPRAVAAGQAHDFPVHDDSPALRRDLAPGALPHHAGPLARVAEAVDEGLRRRRPADPRQERVLQRRPQGQAADPLRRPVGRYLVAAHPPYLLGIGLEEDPEQAPAEPGADPVFEILRAAARPL